MEKQQLDVLMVNSSARAEGSVTRRFAGELLEALRQQHGSVNVKNRDVSKGVPFIDEPWVSASFTPAEARNTDDKLTLAYSDNLVAEVEEADVIVIASPMYNFSIPASLKAWIDQITRPGLTFNYTEEGFFGRLKGKKAYVVIATEGTPLGSEMDFASNYLKFILGFIGIDDVSIIPAVGIKDDDDEAISTVRKHIDDAARQAA